MADLPKTTNKPNVPAPSKPPVSEDDKMIKVTTTPAVALTFEDSDKMPGRAELNAKENPFQEKVNEISRNGKAASIVVPKGDAENGEKWARDQIRRACNNIGKGAITKVEVHSATHVRVWFQTKAKTKRTDAASK